MPPSLQSGLAALLAAVAVSGCSLVTSLDEYDQGTGGGASSAGTGAASSSASAAGGAGGGVGGGGGDPGPASCASSLYPEASSLVDTFDGTASFHGCAVQIDGELRVELPDSGEHYCTSTSDLPYCLLSSSFTFQVGEAANASRPGMQTWMILGASDGSGAIRLLIESNNLRLLIDAGPDSTEPTFVDGNSSYDPFTNVWFRLQGDAGDIVVFTSPDAEAWTERARAPSVVDLDGMFLELGANRYVNSAHPDSANLPAETARFDCINALDCRRRR